MTFTVGTHHRILPDIALRCRKGIEASPELSDSERAAVPGATAMTLIPRLAALTRSR